jgi:hypothetical protein
VSSPEYRLKSKDKENTAMLRSCETEMSVSIQYIHNCIHEHDKGCSDSANASCHPKTYDLKYMKLLYVYAKRQLNSQTNNYLLIS